MDVQKRLRILTSSLHIWNLKLNDIIENNHDDISLTVSSVRNLRFNRNLLNSIKNNNIRYNLVLYNKIDEDILKVKKSEIEYIDNLKVVFGREDNVSDVFVTEICKFNQVENVKLHLDNLSQISIKQIEEITKNFLEDKLNFIIDESELMDDGCRNPFYTREENEYNSKEILIIRNCIDKILSLIPCYYNDIEKTAFLYQYFGERITYDYEQAEDVNIFRNKTRKSIYDLLVNYDGICEGISATFRNLLLCSGINAMVFYSEGKDCHAWNIVKIGEKWYHCDLTFDLDNFLDCNRKISYFLKRAHPVYNLPFSTSNRELMLSILYSMGLNEDSFSKKSKTFPGKRLSGYSLTHLKNKTTI